MLLHDKYADQTDEELIGRFLKTGNNEFVGLLYSRYGHLVLGLSLKYLKNRDDASDAVVQIFSNLINDLKRHKVTFFKSWLYVYSKNYCLMQLRKRQSALKRDLELRENTLILMDFSDSAHLNEKERQILVMEKAIVQLKEEQRTCIELFYLKNKSYAEICSITGYNTNEVKSHIQNGKRNLKIKMEDLSDEKTAEE